MPWIVLLIGCGWSGPDCEQVNAGAVDAALVQISQLQACQEDSDCTVIGVNGSCFDVCSRAIRADAQGDWDAAVDRIEEDWCSQGAGCFFEVPPCAPPGEAHCVDGACLE